MTAALPLLDRPHGSLEAGAELSKARMEMTRLLMDYALFKHREIFAPVLAAGGDKTHDCLRLKTACIAAGQEYRDFTRSGNRADPLADWDGYRASAMAMARTMAAHLADERAGLRKLLGALAKKAVSEGFEPPATPPAPPLRDETVNIHYI
ncbi:hypothetical protein [Sphingomonas ginsenosidivorax]|nr:hypothetical protein [Sphingomonas ginsenosidivorax]